MRIRGKVYVTQEPVLRNGMPNVDLAPAEAFGEIVFLATRDEVEKGTEDDLLDSMRERATGFDPATDYLLPIGHAVSMIAGAIALLERSDGTLRVMQWDRRLAVYEVFDLDLGELVDA